MTINVKYLILGAGPSGLAFASHLMRNNEKSLLIVEKENEPGGLCRSKIVDKSPLDIGGGHFLDIKKQNVLDFVFSFISKSEWELFERVSTIKTSKFEIDYPYESNIWQLPVEDQVEHLISIATAGSNTGKKMPHRFNDWIVWKLGTIIANNYLLPYNSKIFSDITLNELGTYWLYKLPNVSFDNTLRSCLDKKPFGKLPAHANFYYPKNFGYGELFTRIADYIGKERILLNYKVNTINTDGLMVNNEIIAEKIITTIPWTEMKESNTFPKVIKNSIEELKFSSINITYHPETIETNAFWTYFPDEQLSYHRILYRDKFINGAKGYWEETNTKRFIEGRGPSFYNKYAYPLNTIRKPSAIKKILEWSKSRSIFGLGRWGEWEHMNSDVAIENALNLAKKIG